MILNELVVNTLNRLFYVVLNIQHNPYVHGNPII